MSDPVLLVINSDNRIYCDNLTLEKEAMKTTIKELHPNIQLRWLCIDNNNLELIPRFAVTLLKCLPGVIYFPKNEWNNYMRGFALHNVSIMNFDILAGCDKKYHKAIISWLDIVSNLSLTSSDITTRRNSLIDSIKKYLKSDIYGTMLCNYLNTMTHEEFDQMTSTAVRMVSNLIGPIKDELPKMNKTVEDNACLNATTPVHKETSKETKKLEEKSCSNITEENCRKVVALLDVNDGKIPKLTNECIKRPDEREIVRKPPSKRIINDSFRLRPSMLRPKDFISYKFNIRNISMDVNYDLSSNVLKLNLENSAGHVSVKLNLN